CQISRSVAPASARSPSFRNLKMARSRSSTVMRFAVSICLLPVPPDLRVPLPGPASLRDVGPDVGRLPAVGRRALPDLDDRGMAHGLEGAGNDARAFRQLRERPDQVLGGIREHALQRVELVRLDGVEESREEALEDRAVDIARALRREDEAEL